MAFTNSLLGQRNRGREGEGPELPDFFLASLAPPPLPRCILRVTVLSNQAVSFLLSIAFRIKSLEWMIDVSVE